MSHHQRAMVPDLAKFDGHSFARYHGIEVAHGPDLFWISGNFLWYPEHLPSADRLDWDNYLPGLYRKTPLKRLVEEITMADLEEADKEIEILSDEIRQMAQMAHQAYHEEGTWQTCRKGICARASHTLRSTRPRGQP